MKWFIVAGILLLVNHFVFKVWIRGSDTLLAKATLKILTWQSAVFVFSLILSVLCFLISLIWLIIEKL